jgi:hypothetical protein
MAEKELDKFIENIREKSAFGPFLELQALSDREDQRFSLFLTTYYKRIYADGCSQLMALKKVEVGSMVAIEHEPFIVDMALKIDYAFLKLMKEEESYNREKVTELSFVKHQEPQL